VVTTAIEVPQFTDEGSDPPRESEVSLDARGYCLLPAAPGSPAGRRLRQLLQLKPLPQDLQEAALAVTSELAHRRLQLEGPRALRIKSGILFIARFAPYLGLTGLALHAVRRLIDDDDVRLIRVSDWSLYRREETIRDIPAGSDLEISVEYRLGLTESQTEELSQEIGASLGEDKVASISAKLTDALKHTTTVERQRTSTEKLTIRNTGSGLMNVAVWHINHQIVIEELDDVGGPQQIGWARTSAFEYEPNGYRLSTWPRPASPSGA
jgi:hypothetical protein